MSKREYCLVMMMTSLRTITNLLCMDILPSCSNGKISSKEYVKVVKILDKWKSDISDEVKLK